MSSQKQDYGFKFRLHVPFTEAIEQVTAALKQQGFGILTQIDVKSTLKQKLNVDMGNYIILGACNPPLAYRALQAEPEVGLLLPCNVIIFEGKDANDSVVSIVDPLAVMKVTENPALETIADEARTRLEKVVAALKQHAK